MDICKGNCCHTDKLKPQKCPTHTNQTVKYLCLNGKCHQILCSGCLSSHQQLHKKNNLPKMQITSLTQLSSIYTQKRIKSQLDEITHRKEQPLHKPQQLINSFIDESLYGTAERRQRQLEHNLALVKSQAKTSTLLKMIQDDMEKSVKDNKYSEFKEKYFKFLDNLFEDIQAGVYG